MEGNNREAYGYLPTQTYLASGSYHSSMIDPRILLTGSVLSQNMDAGSHAFEANARTGIAPPNVQAQNNPFTRDDNSPPAKKRRGRPPGSKNKPKVDATLSGPGQPKPKRKAMASKKKDKALSAGGQPEPDLLLQSVPSAIDPRLVNNLQQDPPIPVQHQPADQQPPSFPQQGQVGDLQLDHNADQDRTAPSPNSSAIPTEEPTPNAVPTGPPVPTFNITGLLQYPTTPHRQGCPCHACFRDRPFEYKTTKSGASFEIFANLLGEATAAIYQRSEEISYMMGAYADLPAEKLKAQQQKLVRESLATDPLFDLQGNPINSIPLPQVVKEHVGRMATQRMEELARRNTTFTSTSPCVLDGTFVIKEDEDEDEIE